MDDLQQQLLIHTIKKSSFSRIYFITVRDPKQRPLWTKIGKVNDWIRKKTKNYYIVMSPRGGIHFHLICDLPPNVSFTFTKGIHFHIVSLGDDIEKPLFYPTDDERDECRRQLYYEQHREQLLLGDGIRRFKVPRVCWKFAQAVRRYWAAKAKKAAAKLKREEVADRKTRKILSILLYLEQNLYEDRADDYSPELHIDYIYKCQLKSFTTQGHQTPLVSGIDDLTIGP